MEREKLYSCGLTDYLLDKESSIKNPLEKIEDIKKWLDKMNYTEEQINMIVFSLLVLSEEFKDNKIIKIVNKIQLDFNNVKSKNTTGEIEFDYKFSKDNLTVFPKKIYIDSKYRKLIRIQATLLHELRHAMISIKNNVKKTNNNLYSFRRGLCKISLYNKRIINIYGNYLDEIYNTHLTNMNMTELLLLKKNIHSDYLNSLINHQPSGIYRGSAYQEIMYNTYPLLMCDELTKIASYEAYNGDITNYMNAFNNLFSNIISAHEFIMLLEEKKVTKNMTDEMYYQYKRITK